MEDSIFKLPDPRYEEYTWVLQDEHNPAAHTPLISTGKHTGRVVTEPTDRDIPEAIVVNGVNYSRQDIMGAAVSPFGSIVAPETVHDLRKWRTEWLPQMDDLADILQGFDPEEVTQGKWAETLDAHDAEYRRVFGGIHRSAVGPSRLAVSRFVDRYIEIFGKGHRMDAISLLQGFQNKSLDRVYALWDLSRILREDPSLIEPFREEKELPKTSFGLHFQKSMTTMLDNFGHTSNNGLQDLPTWGEGSRVPIEIILSYSKEDDAKNPRYITETQIERRLVLEKELRDTLNVENQDLLTLMGIAQELIPNLEDHNLLCDQRCVYVSRARWLSIGDYMCQKGKLSSRDQVFYYTRNELVTALEGGVMVQDNELNNRRELQTIYRNTYPPIYMGVPPVNAEDISYIPEEGQTRVQAKGVPASPGVYKGRARVIQSLEEAVSLEDGDVLVVRALTPPWTPYLGLIKAVVTNTGGELSHGAVVAREFGIPAVVGTVNGTAVIWDGSVISVDGTNGLVYLEQQ